MVAPVQPTLLVEWRTCSPAVVPSTRRGPCHSMHWTQNLVNTVHATRQNKSLHEVREIVVKIQGAWILFPMKFHECTDIKVLVQVSLWLLISFCIWCSSSSGLFSVGFFFKALHAHLVGVSRVPVMANSEMDIIIIMLMSLALYQRAIGAGEV